MSAYLKFFELEHSPFDTGPQSSVVLGTKALRDAMSQIESGLAEGAPRICVNGKSGLGKTSLARALPKLLRDDARVVLLLNPALPWTTLRAAIVRQLDLEGGVLSRKTLLAIWTHGKRLVVVIDAAEKIDRESLEHLDILLAYRTDDDHQLVHCVLLANLDNARKQPDCPLVWWLDSLNTLQLEFAPIPVTGVRSYIVKHLKRAGWTGGELFSAEAAQAVHRLTGGVPRSVSELCERVLSAAAEQNIHRIGAELVEEVWGERPAGSGAAAESEVSLEAVIARPEARNPQPEPAAVSGLPDDEGNVETAPTEIPHESEASDAAKVVSTGLDAWFGPTLRAEPPAANVRAHADEETGEAQGPEPSDHEEPAELDVESRGGFLRMVAIAIGLLALVVTGLFAGGLLTGNDPAPVTHETTPPPSRSTAPLPAAKRLARAKDSSAPAPNPRLATSVLSDTGSTGPNSRDDGPSSSATKASAARLEPATLHATASDGASSTEREDPGPDGTSSAAPPASPAARDLMDSDDERHF